MKDGRGFAGTGRRVVIGAAAALPFARSAAGRQLYRFDEATGSIEFIARHLGLLTSTGRFGRFRAELLIDPDRPLTSEVAVEVETGTVALGYPGAVELLRSPDFFDSARFPLARFHGAATGEGTLAGFGLAGAVTIRDVTRPLAMRARLVERRRDPALGQEVASFTAEGALSRAAFGMVAEPAAISDTIRLVVRVRLLV